MVIQKFETTQSSYKLILLDEKMPLLDGVETTIKIREYLSTRLPRAEQPFIVCMQENIQSKMENNYAHQQAGMDDFVSKPIFKAVLQKLFILSELIDDPVLS